MKKAVFLSLAVLLQLSLFICTSLAANETPTEETTKKTAPKKKSAKTLKKDTPIPEKKAGDPVVKVFGPAYLTTAFDQTIPKVSVPFYGHDIEQIYNAFTKRKSAIKDEFETTEQYQKRAAAENTAPLLGTVMPDAKIAIPVRAGGKYDADSQTFTMFTHALTFVKQGEYGLGEDIAFPVKQESHSNLTTGQNAYGARVEITEQYKTSYSIAILNLNNFETKKDVLRSIESKMNISSEEAKALKNNISAILVVKPVVPYISNVFWDIAATFNLPIRYIYHLYYVEADLLEVWFFNKETGDVLAKIKPKNAATVSNQ